MRKRTDLPRLETNMDLVIPKGNSKPGTYKQWSRLGLMSKRTTKSTNLRLTRIRYACAFLSKLTDCATRFALLLSYSLFNLMVPMMSKHTWTTVVQQFSCLKNLGGAELLAKRLHIEEYRIVGFVKGTWVYYLHFCRLYRILKLSCYDCHDQNWP